MTRVRTTADLLHHRVNKMHTGLTTVLVDSLDGPLFEELYLRNLVHRATGNVLMQTSLTLKGELRGE